MVRVVCRYCKKKLKSEAGVQRHMQNSAFCIQTRKDSLVAAGILQPVARNLPQKDTSPQKLHKSHKPAPAKMRRLNKDTLDKDTTMCKDLLMQLGKNLDSLDLTTDSLGFLRVNLDLDDDEEDDDDEMPGLGAPLLSEEEEAYIFDPLADSTSEEGTDDEGNGEAMDALGLEEDESAGGDEVQMDPMIWQRSQRSGKDFKKYVRNAYANFAELTETEKTAIKIMHKLIKKRATLDTYNDVMQWHLEESKKLGRNAPLGKSKYYVSRDKLMQKLRKRYDMQKKYATPRTIVLPHTNSKVVIWKKLARDNVIALLTDPRWKDEDWLYFDENPFARPPEKGPIAEDLNTGQAYQKTYNELITKPNQILVAIPLYIDGAVTGQYDKLQVTALKMTLGILNRYARDKEYAWKTLGYVSNYTKEDSRGRKIFVESGHVAAYEMYVDDLSDDDEEGANAFAESDVDKAADYHAILSVLLESLFELIEEGMVVDIWYNDKLYKDCELVFFVPFVKCDGDEGDKLCLSYRSRGQFVQQLCRYCQCPNAETDNQEVSYPYKNEPLLKKLFENNNAEKLKELSQICTKNAFHGLRFGLHNNRGIHGACPWELLHAILLGIFMYTRDCFFAQIGKTSATAQEINSLAVMIGSLLARQSDRKKPRTKFSKGILKGKLMAKEFTGVLLVMAAILRCDAGKSILKSARKKNFKEDWLIRDWTLLVETLLQWEAYLTLAQMEKKNVHRLKRKHKFLMYLLKKVGNRTKGMGFKVMKFHAILHLAYDILMFGVPMVVDTGSNESHHKTTKVAAKLTQKDIKTFEKQTSNRMDDFHVLDLAMEEIDGRPLWEYFSGYYHEEKAEVEDITKTGGMIMNVFLENAITNEVSFKIVTRMENKDRLQFDTQFLEFVLKMQQELVHLIPKIPICAEHSRNGIIFRAHPNYRGKGPWRDWVMINWDEGEYPAQIMGFLDLRGFPEGERVRLTNGKTVERGVYAVVESCLYVDELRPESDIFRPLKLETTLINDAGSVAVRKFYVVEVDSFIDPIVVIPNIGAVPRCQYLLMAPRCEWAEDFKAWIGMPHELDEEEMAQLPAPVEAEEDSSSSE